jgi:hypothetical protein
MKIPIKLVRTLAAVALLAGTPVFAGSFTTTFANATGITLNGNAYLTNSPTDRAILTEAVAGQVGSFTMDDLDAGAAIESFTATFKLQLGPGSGNPADGASFNFGPDITATTLSNEEGPGGTALTIEFDTYDNGVANEFGALSTPAVGIKFGGVVIANHPYAKTDMVTGQLEDVAVQLTRAGKVSVTYKGQMIFTNVLVPGWGPTFGMFNMSARAGGEYEWNEVANLSINTVLQGAAVAPTITTPPAGVTVNEHGTNTWSVVVDGTAPFTFQWTDNNVDIAGETGPTLTMVNIPFTENNHQIRVRVSNPANTAGVTSAAAVLTVIRDTTPPTVVKANVNAAGDQVTVVYSKPVSDTALDTSLYGIDQGVVISYITRSSDTTVVLHPTTPLPGGLTYILSIHGVQDTSSTPNTMAATQVTFRSSLFQAAALVHKKYLNMADGASDTTLFGDPRYNNSPDRQELVAMWEYPANGSGRDAVADPTRNYMDTVDGFFTPATNGDYVFFIAGADNVWLYLSTDSDPANKQLVCSFAGWTNAREWLTPQSPDTNNANQVQTNNLRTDRFTTTAWPVPDPVNGGAIISLTNGGRYYMELIHGDRSWSGGDDFAVTFKLVGQPDPAVASAPLLTGSLIGAYLDPTGASVTFSQQPTNVTILQGRTATFTAVVTGQSLYGTSVAFQWQTAPSGSTTFTNIPGETKASYTTPALQVVDSGRQYKLLATVPGFTQSSSVATVTVNADKTPPNLVSVAALPSQSGTTFDVGVTFDEPLDPTSAGTPGNYTISAGTITGLKFYAVSPGVVLTVSGLTAGTAYSVTVTGVADVNANHITSANMPGTYSGMHWGVVGGDELQLGNGVVAVGPNAFDIYSDSIGEWAAYDEATFVYEQVTGDFDKELRVEYVDPASQWARAGLIVRDVPNFGVNRAAQTGSGSATPPWDGVAGRYQKVHVQPVITAMGTPGANDYESNRRLDTGGQTDGPQTVGHTPAYPNAWVRIQRVGQTFTKFASDDGVNWINLGTTTWGVDDVSKTPMPDTVYVGPDYAPENGNVNPASLRAMFGIKVRDYRNHGALALPTLTATKNADGTFTLTYTGTLVSSDTAKGTYNPVSGASSPWKVDPKATGAKATQFYRAQQ